VRSTQASQSPPSPFVFLLTGTRGSLARQTLAHCLPTQASASGLPYSLLQTHSSSLGVSVRADLTAIPSCDCDARILRPTSSFDFLKWVSLCGAGIGTNGWRSERTFVSRTSEDVLLHLCVKKGKGGRLKLRTVQHLFTLLLL